jgi:hypothetical protein
MESNDTEMTIPPPKPKVVVRKAADVMECGSSAGKKKSGMLFGKRLDDT